jgi:DNA-binding CsgD family transcriptional regulator
MFDTSQFSEREKDVVQLLLQGKSNKQIAIGLGISNRTVEFHLRNIYTKLSVNSRAEAILMLTESDLWKSTGSIQAKSTVEQISDSTENSVKLFSRRNAMKNLYFISGVLLITSIVIVSNLMKSKSDPLPSIPTEQMEINSIFQESIPVTTAPISLNYKTKLLINEQRDYYTVNLDGTDKTLVYSGENSPLTMASLSPTATKFAYFNDNSIYVQDLQTGETVTANKEIIGSIGGQIRWSPDETTLALTCATEQQPSSGVCLINVQNGDITFLVNETTTDNFCSTKIIELMDWSVDGSKIIYNCFVVPEKGHKQDFAIYVYNVNEKTSIRVFDGSSQNLIWQIHSASISPNNDFLLLNGAGESPIAQIFLLNLSDNTLKQLTQGIDYHSSAALWLDNQTFFAHRELTHEPYLEANSIMDVNGENKSDLEIQGTIVK